MLLDWRVLWLQQNPKMLLKSLRALILILVVTHSNILNELSLNDTTIHLGSECKAIVLDRICSIVIVISDIDDFCQDLEQYIVIEESQDPFTSKVFTLHSIEGN